MIKEQNTTPELTDEQKKELDDFFAAMKAYQETQKALGKRSLGEEFYATYEEFNRAKGMYVKALVATSILGNLLWKFYARPTAKISWAAWKSFCRFAQSQMGVLVKMQDSMQGSLSGRKPIPLSDEIKLSKMIDDVVVKNSEPGAVKRWSRSLKAKTSGVLTFGRLGKLLSLAAGLMWYNADEYDPSDDRASLGTSGLSDMYILFKDIMLNKVKNFIMIEAFWMNIRIMPLMQAGDYRAKRNMMLYGTIGGTFFLKLLLSSWAALTNRRKHPISIKQASKIFEDAVLTSVKGGAGRLQDDIIEGTNKAVDDVFAVIKKKRFSKIDEIPEELGRGRGGLTGEAYLKEKIKNALAQSVKTTTDSAQKTFNTLVKEVNEDFAAIAKTSTGGISNTSKQIETVNQIIVKCYAGANKGVDNALGLASKRMEKDRKRASVFWRDAARSERAHLVNSLKAVGESKISNSVGDAVGEFDQILRLRRETYSASVQDLLLDLRAIDEDFLTYHYLSNAKPPSVKGGSQLGADAAASRLRRPSNRETHFMKLGQAKEEVINRFQKELEEINKIFKDAENPNMNIAEPLEILDNAKINKVVEEAYEIAYTRAKDGGMKVDDWFKNADNVKEVDDALLTATKRGDNGVGEAESLFNALKPANDDVPFEQLQDDFIDALSSNPDARTEFANILEHLQDGNSAFGRG